MVALYTTLSDQVDESLEYLSRRLPHDHPDRPVRDRLWRAARILQQVLRGLEDDYHQGEEDQEAAPYPLPESALK
jgi:hypothetical protein